MDVTAVLPNMGPFPKFNRVGVFRMIGVRDISTRDLAHFLHLAQGDDYIRAHNGRKYIFTTMAKLPHTPVYFQRPYYLAVEDTRSASRARCGG